MRYRRMWRCLSFFVLGWMVAGVAEAHPKVARREDRKRVPGQWIVVLRDNVTNVDAVAEELAGRGRGRAGNRFEHSVKGFVLHRTDVASPDEVAQDPRVLFIEPDGVATLFGHRSRSSSQPPQQLPTGNNRVDAELNPNAGTGVKVAVIDTGIQLNHPDLKVVGNVTFVKGTKSGNDDNGHGTHVAGIAGALDNTIGVVGVAPSVSFYAVKVLNKNGSGFFSDVIKGIDWVTKNKDKIAVANMSLGGGLTNADDGNCGNTNLDAVHRAICRSVDAGVIYVVAAGNSARDAKDFRPAAYDEVISISALADSDGQPNGTGPATSFGEDDTFATFSNFGSDIDLIAPGVNIRSTWKGSSYATASGTSMSAPHVAGAVALWIAQHGRPITGNARDPAVRAMMTDISEAVGSFVGDSDFTPEPMLNANTAAVGGTGTSVCCPAP